ncbi:VOC family protein [Brevibacillus daliensis]|uniref:VOC family protein n=1 Tax=Brevibacillus daliensis TaxID=2892995 RepID=UPI001E2F9ACA|nr:VOC family protein [Brevibacillus daliensis]
MLQLQGVHHIALSCRNMITVARFFQEVLEVPLSLERTDEEQPIYFHVGPYTRIGLHPASKELPSNSGHVDHIAFAVATRDELDYLVDKLEAENICYRGPLERPNSYNLYFETPDGHHLEIRLAKDETDDA